jgi:hypothetical protein
MLIVYELGSLLTGFHQSESLAEVEDNPAYCCVNPGALGAAPPSLATNKISTSPETEPAGRSITELASLSALDVV